ncbi:hypothetical protein [uncultured Ruthenibacterium sp.]|uniref:hypothetical protein n=1 Tax=uncultured Ruthenibacterium sp. TaxID=1905347 RepID=UPI00349E8B7A
MEQGNTALRKRLEALARAYVPQWHFDPDDPDVGSVAALLLEDMVADSEKRFEDILRLHKIHYLNLFDRLRPDISAPARSYVCFQPVAGSGEPVYVPKGTELLADSEDGEPSLTFETTESITVSEARLNTIVSVEQSTDRIVTVLDGDDAARCVFTPFDPVPDSESHHIFTLAFDRGLAELDEGELGLKVITPDPEQAQAAATRLTDPSVVFFIPEVEGEYILSSPRLEKDTLWFSVASKQFLPVEFDGVSRYLLCARANAPIDLSLSGAVLTFSRSNIVPQDVRCGGVMQTPGHFYPFGSPLELYGECGIECPAVFDRPGATITMEFDLNFETLEQKLPEVEIEVDYKVIMKKTVQAPRPETRDVQPDYVLVEYLSTRGWKRLLADEHVALLFNGSAQGHVKLDFICPADFLPSGELAGDYRLRFRLMRADGLYQLPCRQHIPVMSGLHFSYRYEDNPLKPCQAQTVNNFVSQDLLLAWGKGKSTPLFFTNERRGACLYFGFDESPQGSPLSLYFEVENNEDLPLDYSVEYLSPMGFAPVQVQDGTGGLLYSGTLLALVPADAARSTLYGKNRYWLRLVCRDDLAMRPGMPLVRGIIMNMVPVENRKTRIEEFYVDDLSAPVRFQLGEKPVLSARVYVNEMQEDRPDEDHWVLWQRRKYAAQRGRFYELDSAEGAVTFDRHTFSVYVPPQGAASVRVEYQSYQGKQGNIPQGSIHTMAAPIRHIAHLSNPLAAYGGTEDQDETAAAKLVSNLLRTRGRAVSERDYFDIISQLGCGVRQIKCCAGKNRQGADAPDTITVALLIDEYEKGSHIFSTVKDTVRHALTAESGILPLGKTLVLCQPRFVRFSVRIWVRCTAMESVYEVQRRTNDNIRRFLDPLAGGFDGRGWKIGVLPTAGQLLAFVKMKDPDLRVERMALVACAGGREYAVDNEFPERIKDPFAMAVNGEHTVYVDLD